jgi:hypothetical protein
MNRSLGRNGQGADQQRGSGLHQIYCNGLPDDTMRRVSVPPIPTPLSQLGNCPFSFYPAIVGIEHNEWIFRRATWSEIQVVNTKTAIELWLPRHFVGEISMVGEPVIIVGLVKELEYREDAVIPHVRRVIEMPRAVNGSASLRIRPAGPPRPAAVVGIRLERRESRAGRLLLVTVAAGVLACIAAASFASRSALSAAIKSELPLTARDDYNSIVERYGPPASDQWRTAKTGVEYRRLTYPRQSFTLILIDGRYAGAVGRDGRVIHSSGPALKTLR